MISTTSLTTSENSPVHIPVLLEPVVNAFQGAPHEVHIDGTTGLGGHLMSVLERYPALQRALAVDMDPSHLSLAQERLSSHPQGEKVTWIHAPFEDLARLCAEQGATGKVSSILLDLGLCSAHVDIADRGFSFMKEGPLDMRFDTTQTVTAAYLLSSLPEEKLADIIFRYGEERFSRRIAKAIVDDRRKEPFTSTTQLAEMIARVIPGGKKPGFHPATRTFQALRIAVNNELAQIETVIEAALTVMKPGGILAIITYHSLEDRIVKHAFKDAARDCVCPREQLRCTCPGQPRAQIITKKPIVPDDQERATNPRSRSAKLRVLQLAS